jgi:uncharacterized oxidoreductase
MATLELDIADLGSLQRGVAEMKARYPRLNMLLNNAGLMAEDNAGGETDDDILTAVINTNLLGTLRLTSLLAEQLKSQSGSAILNMTSVMGFLPFFRAACYAATKAALHSYTISQRYAMRPHGVKVIEIVPPRVETHAEVPRSPFFMSLDDFVTETMALIEAGEEEVVLERAKPFRNNPGPGEHALINKLNEQLADVELD